MAEKRDKLTIESNALCKDERLHSKINLTELLNLLVVTEISHDAGKFVCEGLYYQVLKYIQAQPKNIDCIFVHVPLLRDSNLGLILEDFHFMFTWFNLKLPKNTEQYK